MTKIPGEDVATSLTSETLAPPLHGLLARWGEGLTSMPAWLFCSMVGVMGAVRIGPAGIGPNLYDGMRHAAEEWPSAVNTLQTSPGVVLLIRALGMPSAPAWWLVGSLVWLAVWGTTFLVLARRGPWGRLAVIALAASPAFAVTASMIGHYDMFMVAGSLLVALARSRSLGLLGAVVATSANTEQALVAACAFILVGLASRDREGWLRGVVWLSWSLLVTLALALTMPPAPEMMTRVDALGDGGVLFGLRLYLAMWPLATYAFLGALWIPVLLRLATAGSWLRGVSLALGLIFLPIAASVATLDGTRVFVMTGFAALLLAGRTWRPTRALPEWTLAAALAVMVATPAIVTMPEPSGLIRLPWNELLTVLGWPIDWTLVR